MIVDPFCNYTAVCHPEMKWIPILPNTDVAFDYGVIYVWLTEGLYDKEYVATHTVHFDKLEDYVLGREDGIPKTPEWAAERCGVPEWTIKAYARNVAKKVTSHAHFSSGSVKTPYSHEPGRTGAYKLALQGLGKPGVQQLHLNASSMAKANIARSTSAPYSSINQCRMFYPNVQSIPRTMVAEALTEGHVKWWGSPCIVYVETSEQFQEFNYPADPKAALAMQQAMAQAMGMEPPTEEPRISKVHMLWSEKPCNMNCWDGGFNFQDAIRTNEVEFFVTNHQWLENDSLFADLVLPVTTCVEDNDSMGSGMIVFQPHSGLTPPACERVGESLSDFEIACAIGERFGIREQIDLGMTQDEWIKYGVRPVPLGRGNRLGRPSRRRVTTSRSSARGLERDVCRACVCSTRIPRPIRWTRLRARSSSGAQALADNFPDDKERTPMARWIIGEPAEEGWTPRRDAVGRALQEVPVARDRQPRPLPRARAGRRHQVVPRD